MQAEQANKALSKSSSKGQEKDHGIMGWTF